MTCFLLKCQCYNTKQTNLCGKCFLGTTSIKIYVADSNLQLLKIIQYFIYYQSTKSYARTKTCHKIEMTAFHF